MPSKSRQIKYKAAQVSTARAKVGVTPRRITSLSNNSLATVTDTSEAGYAAIWVNNSGGLKSVDENATKSEVQSAAA